MSDDPDPHDRQEGAQADDSPATQVWIHGRNILIGNSGSPLVGDNLQEPTSSAPSQGFRWGRFVVGLATVLGTVVAVVALVLTIQDQGEPGGGGIDSPTARATSEPLPHVEAKIDKTWDVELNTYVGVFSYGDPAPGRQDTKNGHYPEGGTITVVCYKPDGRVIKDKPWRVSTSAEM